jgi:hypothetical protein
LNACIRSLPLAVPHRCTSKLNSRITVFVHRCRLVASALSVILLSLFPTFAQRPAIAAISSYTTQVDKFIGHHRGRVFANAVTEDEQDNWREFKGVGELERSETAYDERANVWLKSKNPVAARFALTSPSGDWIHYLYYYFRADGTLAKIQSRLNTFHGNVTVIRDKFYDAEGKLLRTTTRYLDLHSQKPIRPRDFMDDEIPVYQRTQDLPFYKLL